MISIPVMAGGASSVLRTVLQDNSALLYYNDYE